MIGSVVRTIAGPFTYSVTITAAPVTGELPGPPEYLQVLRLRPYHPDALVYEPGLIPPDENKFVPGTLKQRSGGRYYIRKEDQEPYRQLCQNLFTQQRKADDKEANRAVDTAERIQAGEGLQ